MLKSFAQIWPEAMSYNNQNMYVYSSFYPTYTEKMGCYIEKLNMQSLSQSAFTCSKLTTETPKQDVKYFLLFTLNR